MSATSMLKVRCPRCSTEFRIPPTEAKAECPKCHARIAVTVSQKASGATASSQPSSDKVESAGKSAATAAAPLPDPNSFFSFLQYHFLRSHGSALWGLIAGLAAVPLISLAKPVIKFSGILATFEVILVVAAAAGVAYCVEQFLAFALWRQGQSASNARSWLAPFVYNCFIFLIPIGLLTAIESVTPPYGLVATMIPVLRGADPPPAGRWDDNVASALPQPNSPAPRPPQMPVKVESKGIAPNTPPPSPAATVDTAAASQPAAVVSSRTPPAPVIESQPTAKEIPPQATATAVEPRGMAAGDASKQSAPGAMVEGSHDASREPGASTVQSVFVIRERDERGPLVQGAIIELWYRASENDTQVLLGTTVTNALGKAEIAVESGAAGRTSGEYGVTVSHASVSKSWILSDYPEAAGWNLSLPVR